MQWLKVHLPCIKFITRPVAEAPAPVVHRLALTEVGGCIALDHSPHAGDGTTCQHAANLFVVRFPDRSEAPGDVEEGRELEKFLMTPEAYRTMIAKLESMRNIDAPLRIQLLNAWQAVLMPAVAASLGIPFLPRPELSPEQNQARVALSQLIHQAKYDGTPVDLERKIELQDAADPDTPEFAAKRGEILEQVQASSLWKASRKVWYEDMTARFRWDPIK